jgi:hypothetical protein
MNDTLGDDARFATARPGNDQQRAFSMLDRFQLFGVQLKR